MTTPNLIELASLNGNETVGIHPWGASVISWQDMHGCERLYLSQKADLSGSKPIRGGVPISFPQFAVAPEANAANGMQQFPGMPNHGFARSTLWIVESVTQDTAVLTLSDSEESRAIWPYRFTLHYSVTVRDGLHCTLSVRNTDTQPWRFQTALHTYFLVSDVSIVAVEGVAGLTYRDKVARGSIKKQSENKVHFKGEVDSIFFNAPNRLKLLDLGISSLELGSEHFTDAVVWNPGKEKAATIKDMNPEDYRYFVCVEAAIVEAPPLLAPGESWSGSVTYRAV